jgi:malate dehydrogenase (oxaloacetate-decarboxylating)(NADP+)
MAYGEQNLSFGPEYLIPKPFDPRLILKIAPAVAKAAMDSGVATRPITDFNAYRDRLMQFIHRSGLTMKPVLEAAKQSPKRLVYCEGEDDRVLHAVQQVIDEGLAKPILVGRPAVVNERIQKLGLRIRPGVDFKLIDPENLPQYQEYWNTYYSMMQRRGVSIEYARREVRRRTTLIGALMLHMGEAEAMLCGTFGHYQLHLDFVMDALGLRPGVHNAAAMNMLLHPKGTFFICDTYVTPDPSAEQIAEMTMLAAEEVQRFGMTPKVALLSHSSFGSVDTPSSRKMREALRLLEKLAPNLEVDGEMHGDAALSEEIRNNVFSNSRLKGRANLLIMPTLDAANISFNLIKMLGEGVTVGPILLGCAKPVHILTPTATVRRIVNMTALAVVDANAERFEQTSLKL